MEARHLYRQGEQIDDPVALIGYGRLLARTLSRPESADAVSRYRRQAAAGQSPALAILGAFLLRRGAVDEASQLRERIRATGSAYVRAYAEALAKDYDLDSTTG